MLEIKEFNKIIVANWKLNGSNDFLEAYFEVCLWLPMHVPTSVAVDRF